MTELKCKACKQSNHPHYDKKYGGYCLDCANAGAPEKDEEIVKLRAALEDCVRWSQLGIDHCREAKQDASDHIRVRRIARNALEEDSHAR